MKNKRLTVAIWYPADEKPSSMEYFLVKRILKTEVAKESPLSSGCFPLIIFSHGGGGSATSMAIYAEELASKGFIVAGPDHSDEFIACRSDRKMNVKIMDWLKWAHNVSKRVAEGEGKTTKFEHRPLEIKSTIDILLKLNKDEKSVFYKKIDEGKIGIMGVSFGAWTSLAVAGGIPFYHDKRIKCVVSIAGPVKTTEYISRIKVPVMIIFGEKETTVLLDPTSPAKTGRMINQYKTGNPPKYLIGVKGAKHLNFGGAGVFNLKMGKSVSTEEVRLKDPITGVVNKYTVAFFMYYLKNEKQYEKILTSSDPRLFLFKFNH